MNPAAMTKDFCDYQTKGSQSQKILTGKLVLDELKESVEDSDAWPPLLINLKNWVLKQYCSQSTASQLGNHIFADEQFRFNCLFELSTFHCVDQMATICGQATNEQTRHDILMDADEMIDKFLFIGTLCRWHLNVYFFNDFVLQPNGTQSVAASLRAQAGGRLLCDFATMLEVLAQVMNMNNVFSSADVRRRLFEE
jgi:hypothetical protein